MKLDEVDMAEVLSANLVNNISPVMLNSRLKPLMLQSSFPDKFIINVTSSEGQFSYAQKTIYHPHTNMTKAARIYDPIVQGINGTPDFGKLYKDYVVVAW